MSLRNPPTKAQAYSVSRRGTAWIPNMRFVAYQAAVQHLRRLFLKLSDSPQWALCPVLVHFVRGIRWSQDMAEGSLGRSYEEVGQTRDV